MNYTKREDGIFEFDISNYENILVVGDVHADWDNYNKIIKDKKPDIIIQVGDFGYFPKFDKYNIDQIKSQGTKTIFIGGNHEDWWALNEIEESGEMRLTTKIKRFNKELDRSEMVDTLTDVWYAGRTSIIKYKNKNILMIGGASSIDRNQRIVGHDWFPEEVIPDRVLYNLPDIKVDVIITHTCPAFIRPLPPLLDDPSEHILTEVWNKYKPDFWFMGHWHLHEYNNAENTTFEFLNMMGNSFCTKDIKLMLEGC